MLHKDNEIIKYSILELDRQYNRSIWMSFEIEGIKDKEIRCAFNFANAPTQQFKLDNRNLKVFIKFLEELKVKLDEEDVNGKV